MKHSKISSVLAIVFFAVVLCMFSSCTQDESEVTVSEIKESFVFSEVDSLLASKIKSDLGIPELRVSTGSWGSYSFLSSTGNHSLYFSAGVYAVKAERSISDGNPLTMDIDIQSDIETSPTGAYAWAYKFDVNANQLYFSGSLPVQTSIVPIPDISITGNQYIVYVFQVITSGYYMCWYRKS